MSAAIPPPLHGPTSKERKYDRQLRLWAASGQAALEDAHVLLVNASVVGTETLKNLILPGIGAFTVLDLNKVMDEDLGANFFLEQESEGKSRAEETCRYLQELNPDVKGHWLQPSRYGQFLTDPANFSSYTLIIVTAPANVDTLEQIAKHCHKTRTPLFYVRSVGFYGSFSMQLPDAFPIVDTHPDPDSTSDLRLLKPWPSLVEYASSKSRDLDKMPDHEHGHVPYLVLLLHYLNAWKESHEGRVPSNYKEKNELRSLVRAGMRSNNAEGGEENFEEAIGAVLKNLNDPTPSSAVREVFNAPECLNLTRESPNFWVIARAVSQFFQDHGVLPLPGTVPDMKAQSADYMELQAVYKSKARQDAAEVLQKVRKLEADLGRTNIVDEKEVEAFCKGAAHIKLIRGRPLHVVDDADSNVIALDWSDSAKACAHALTDDSSHIILYIALLAYDRVFERYGQVPAQEHLQWSLRAMKDYAHMILNKLLEQGGKKLNPSEAKTVASKLRDMCSEITRASGGELHSISALVGGLVAQDVIKVITKQYVPVDNTCLFDGIKSTASVLRI